MVYQGGPIDNFTHVPGLVEQSIAEIEYNASCTSVMAISYFRMINNKLLNKYLDSVPEKASLIILYIKSDIYMSNNGKDTKHTRQISIGIHFVRIGEECNLNKIVCCEVGLKLTCIGNNNGSEDKLNN